MQSSQRQMLRAARKHARALIQLLQEPDADVCDAAPHLIRGWLALRSAHHGAPLELNDLVHLPEFLGELERSGMRLRAFSIESWASDMQQLAALSQRFADSSPAELSRSRLWDHCTLYRRALRSVESGLSVFVRLLTPAKIALLGGGLFGFYFLAVNRTTGSGPWKAEFFPNTDLLSEPAKVTRFEDVKHDWTGRNPFPDFPSEDFSVRFTTVMTLPSAQTLTFQLRSDDGSRLLIDGNLTIDLWSRHTTRTESATVLVSEGSHTVEVDYFQVSGDGTISLELIPASGKPHAIPGEQLRYPQEDKNG